MFLFKTNQLNDPCSNQKKDPENTNAEHQQINLMNIYCTCFTTLKQYTQIIKKKQNAYKYPTKCLHITTQQEHSVE